MLDGSSMIQAVESAIARWQRTAAGGVAVVGVPLLSVAMKFPASADFGDVMNQLWQSGVIVLVADCYRREGNVWSREKNVTVPFGVITSTFTFRAKSVALDHAGSVVPMYSVDAVIKYQGLRLYFATDTRPHS